MAAVVKGLEIKILGLSAGIRRYEFTAHLGIPGNRLSEIESGRLHNLSLCAIVGQTYDQKGGMPLARLQLRHLTGGGRFYLNHRGEKLRPMVPQFPLAEPAL